MRTCMYAFMWKYRHACLIMQCDTIAIGMMCVAVYILIINWHSLTACGQHYCFNYISIH